MSVLSFGWSPHPKVGSLAWCPVLRCEANSCMCWHYAKHICYYAKCKDAAVFSHVLGQGLPFFMRALTSLQVLLAAWENGAAFLGFVIGSNAERQGMSGNQSRFTELMRDHRGLHQPLNELGTFSTKLFVGPFSCCPVPVPSPPRPMTLNPMCLTLHEE